MFSIVIPLFNKQESVQAAILSILGQSFQDYEMIIIDDGSEDKSVEMIQKLDDPRIRLVRQDNQGVSAARNKGIELAEYPFIALLDADDCWEPEYLEEQSRLIRDFPDAAMWACSYGHIYFENKTEVDHSLPKGFRGYLENYFTMKRKTDIFSASSVVIRKNALEITGYFDPRLKVSEDLDLWYRIIHHFPVVFYNKTLAYYRQDAENRVYMVKPKLKDFLPYYIDKYDLSENADPAFVRFIYNWTANKLFYYFFDTKAERDDARTVISKLDFSKLKWTFRLMYKTPFFLGYLAYRMNLLRQRLAYQPVKN